MTLFSNRTVHGSKECILETVGGQAMEPQYRILNSIRNHLFFSPSVGCLEQNCYSLKIYRYLTYIVL